MDTLPAKDPKARQITLLEKLGAYLQDLYLTHKRKDLKGEGLWSNLIKSFRPHTIEIWKKDNSGECIDLLTSRGVHVDMDCSRSPTECVINFLYRESHIETNKLVMFRQTEFSTEGSTMSEYCRMRSGPKQITAWSRGIVRERKLVAEDACKP